MMERDTENEIMAYGYTAWYFGIVLVGIIFSLMFGFANSISG